MIGEWRRGEGRGGEETGGEKRGREGKGGKEGGIREKIGIKVRRNRPPCSNPPLMRANHMAKKLSLFRKVKFLLIIPRILAGPCSFL